MRDVTVGSSKVNINNQASTLSVLNDLLSQLLFFLGTDKEKNFFIKVGIHETIPENAATEVSLYCESSFVCSAYHK